MNTLRIACYELLQLLRNPGLQVLAGLVTLLTAYCLITGVSDYHLRQARRLTASRTMRQQFLSQGAINPHTAAHYGHYVFKPYSFLNALDAGIEPYVGVTLRLESHQQNDAIFTPSQDQSSLIRFGQLSFSLVLQVVFPLLLIFMGHRAVVSERQGGTLPLLMAQGITMRQLVWGKVLAHNALIGMVLLSSAGILYGTIFLGKTSDSILDLYPRIGLLLLLYGLYYSLIIALTVYASARFTTPGRVLVTLLTGWLLLTVVLPKAALNAGDQLLPLPSKLAWQSRIDAGNRNGINGHDPKDQRAERLKTDLLKKYGVDSLERLPINAEGIIMQEDEDYHNQLYDSSLTTIQMIIHGQNRVGSLVSLIDPFLAVRNLSMSLSQTDINHHFRFMNQAERYRRGLVRRLNDELAYGGSKTGDWDWAVKADYWQRINDFRYSSPPISWSLAQWPIELGALGFWVLGTLLLIHLGTEKLPII